MIEAAEAEGKGRRVQCEVCASTMRHKGYRDRGVMSWMGEVRVRRAYYHCEAVGTGFFPLDRKLGLSESAYSP